MSAPRKLKDRRALERKLKEFAKRSANAQVSAGERALSFKTSPTPKATSCESAHNLRRVRGCYLAPISLTRDQDSDNYAPTKRSWVVQMVLPVDEARVDGFVLLSACDSSLRRSSKVGMIGGATNNTVVGLKQSHGR